MSYATAKGYRAERDVRDYLSLNGLPVYRRRDVPDTGDLHGLPLVVSIKDRTRLDLAGWVGELEDMVGRTAYSAGLLVHKRRGCGDPADWYTTAPLWLAVPLIKAYTVALQSNGSTATDRLRAGSPR